MALPILAPAITKTRDAITQSTQRAFLRLVPEIEGARRTSGKSFVIFGTFLMFATMLAMFVISSLSTKDAFTLAKLQREAQVLSDQRDAINREVAFRSSPNALADAAIKLGMQPNSQPRFLEFTDQING